MRRRDGNLALAASSRVRCATTSQVQRMACLHSAHEFKYGRLLSTAGTDLKSTNGTFLNRGRLRPLLPVEIKPGDTIAFGALLLLLLLLLLICTGPHAPELTACSVGRCAARCLARGASMGRQGLQVVTLPWRCGLYSAFSDDIHLSSMSATHIRHVVL